MNSAINVLLQSILQKNSLEECSVQDLKKLTEKYPYFAAGHLLLFQKLKASGHNDAEQEKQLASLYFSNPLQLDQLITGKGSATIESKKITETLPAPVITEMVSPVSEIETTVEEEEKIETETDHNEPVISIAPLKIEAINPATTELTFEPFHTVDYFASQGIRFRDDEKPKDKLGQQLKSFTDWLKTLRKIPAAIETAGNTNPQFEKKVEQMAEHSIEDREIVTEAMAEVWEKQGNAVKAIETYRKLSLYNPSKSSYFAAKIEQLKNS